MKLIVNTASTFKGGGVQVAQSFIEECKNFGQHEYHVVLGDMLSTLLDPHDYPDNFSFYNIGYRPATRVFSLKSHNSFFIDLEEAINPDVVFTTSGPAYWRPKAPHLAGYNLGHYIYKDSPFFSQIPYHNLLKWYLKGEVIKFFFRKDTDAFIVQTDDVNRRLRIMLNTDKVYTVSNTFSHYYRNPKKAENKLPEKKRGTFRFLTLSAWHTHKNLNIIPKIVTILPDYIKEKVQFVLTLPPPVFEKHFSGNKNRNILNIGPVKPEEGPALYKECDALFLPTLLECFSASYAEAMVMNKPIVTTDLGFAQSVCGNAALYYSAVDPVDASKQIKALVENKKQQEELIQKGRKQLAHFDSPKERAEKYMALCERFASKAIS